MRLQQAMMDGQRQGSQQEGNQQQQQQQQMPMFPFPGGGLWNLA